MNCETNRRPNSKPWLESSVDQSIFSCTDLSCSGAVQVDDLTSCTWQGDVSDRVHSIVAPCFSFYGLSLTAPESGSGAGKSQENGGQSGGDGPNGSGEESSSDGDGSGIGGNGSGSKSYSYVCDYDKNFIPGVSYTQEVLLDNPGQLGTEDEFVSHVEACKSSANGKSFFVQEHKSNGHVICGVFDGAVPTTEGRKDDHARGALCLPQYTGMLL